MGPKFYAGYMKLTKNGKAHYARDCADEGIKAGTPGSCPIAQQAVINGDYKDK